MALRIFADFGKFIICDLLFVKSSLRIRHVHVSFMLL